LPYFDFLFCLLFTAQNEHYTIGILPPLGQKYLHVGAIAQFSRGKILKSILSTASNVEKYAFFKLAKLTEEWLCNVY